MIALAAPRSGLPCTEPDGQVRETPTQGAVGAVGREPELAAISAFTRDAGARAFVLVGEPGIGKTTLWEAGVAAARRSGTRVLVARPSDAEARLAFAALTDLFDAVDIEALRPCPEPQRGALQIALLRAEAGGSPPDPRAIAAGVRSVLGALAADTPLLVAIDDVQWLDRPSADALSFAARRLGDERVGFLLAKRPGSPSELERALERTALQRLDVGPLSLGATRRLLSERLGLSLPRHLLRRIVESTLGNPLFALEVGRMLAERESHEIGGDLPVPDSVEDLLGTRVARLPGPIRRLLLAVSLSADLRTSQLAAIGGEAALEDAVDTGILLLDGDRVRASHPLLAAAAKKRSRPRERRDLHLALAAVVADDDLRALHLALATEGLDAELAAAVATAADRASARAARYDAVNLAEQALRLTPADAAERGDRVLTLAEYLLVVGEPQRAAELLFSVLDSLPAGAARGRAYLFLSQAAATSSDEVRGHLERALAESASDPALRAAVLVELTSHAAVVRVEQLPRAESWALEALRAARDADPSLQRLALYALGWVRALRGRPIDDVCARFLAMSDDAYYVVGSPERVEGQQFVWRGEVRRARAVLMRLLAIADEQGEPVSYALQRLHVCELELRAGDWHAAGRLLDEWAESAEGELLKWPMYERCRALLAAGRGSPDEARRWAAQAIAAADANGVRWDGLEARRAHGIADLLAREPSACGRAPALGLGSPRARGSGRPRRLPGRTGARRGAARGRRPRRGAGRDRSAGAARHAPASSLGHGDGEAVRSFPAARVADLRRRGRGRARAGGGCVRGARTPLRRRTIVARPRPGTAAAPEVEGGARVARAGRLDVRRARVDGVGGDGSLGARARRSAPPPGRRRAD